MGGGELAAKSFGSKYVGFGENSKKVTMDSGDDIYIHCCDERIIRIRCGFFRPLVPCRFLQNAIPWRRCSGLAFLNYNIIIPKPGRNFPAPVSIQENRGVFS